MNPHVESPFAVFPRHLFVGLLLGCMAIASSAQTSQGGQGDQNGGDRPHGPPPEAIAACSGKAVGTACSFVGRRGEQLNGVCITPPARPASAANGSSAYGAKTGVQGGAHEPMPMACRPPRRD